MIHWDDVPVYVHRDPVDFRQSINGLSVRVTESMELDVFHLHCLYLVTARAIKSKYCIGIKPGSAFGIKDWRNTNSNGHAKAIKCYRLLRNNSTGCCAVSISPSYNLTALFSFNRLFKKH